MMGPTLSPPQIFQGQFSWIPTGVVPLTYLGQTAKLVAFSQRRRASLVDVGSQIHEVNASLSFLAPFNFDDR